MIFLMTETTTATRMFTLQLDWIRSTITPTDNSRMAMVTMYGTRRIWVRIGQKRQRL